MLSAENMQHVPAEHLDLFKANSLQLAWAEQVSEESKKIGTEIDPTDWMISHAEWFRIEVIEKPENHILIDNFGNDPEGTVDALKRLFEESEKATKH